MDISLNTVSIDKLTEAGGLPDGISYTNMHDSTCVIVGGFWWMDIKDVNDIHHICWRKRSLILLYGML